METVPEESTAWLTVTFKDKDGNNQAPSSAEYRVDSQGGQELKGWTSINNPTAEHEITLTPSDNKIVEDYSNQTNIVTVRALFGTDDEQNDEYKYEIKGLTKIPKDN